MKKYLSMSSFHWNIFSDKYVQIRNGITETEQHLCIHFSCISGNCEKKNKLIIRITSCNYLLRLNRLNCFCAKRSVFSCFVKGFAFWTMHDYVSRLIVLLAFSNTFRNCWNMLCTVTDVNKYCKVMAEVMMLWSMMLIYFGQNYLWSY